MTIDLSKPFIAEEQALVVSRISVILNTISVLSSVAVILLYFFLRKINRHAVDRVSLRVSVAIAIADLLYSISQIVSDTVRPNTFSCSFSVWGYIGFSHLSLFLAACLAFNLQRLFIQRKEDVEHYELCYYVFSVVLSMGLSLVGLLSDVYGWSEREQTCWFRESCDLWMEIALYYGWIALSLVYCIVIIFIILVKLWRGTYDESAKMVVRTLGYPIVCLITQPLNAVNMVLDATGVGVPFWLFLLSYMATSVQGTLNLLAFCADPMIHQAFRKRKSIQSFVSFMSAEELIWHKDTVQ